MRRLGMLLAVACAAALAQTTPPRPPAPRKPAVAAGIPGYSELKFPELRPLAAPAVQSLVLPNGMQLFLLENHELPLVNGTVLVRTGSAFDPPDKIGLAAFTEQLLLEGGSTALPGEDLPRKLEGLGADVGGNVTENSLSISFSALKENTDAVAELLKDVLTAPEFPQDRLDLIKVQLRNSIAHRNDDPAAMLQREFVTALYGKSSPYGARMEHANVDRINRSDLVAFYQRYFFPGNLILSLEGDFDSASMKARVEALFDDWKAVQQPVPDFPKASGAASGGRFLAVRKDVSRAFFAIGEAGGDSPDSDYPALQVMCGILGGGPQSRLNQHLLGNVDELSVTWSPPFGHPGLFKVSGTVVNPFVTTRVLRTIGEELNRIRVEEVSDQELRTARNAAVNSLVFAFDSQFSVLPRLTQYAYYHFPPDYTQQYQKALEAVTRADVLRVARERFDPARLITVVVANPTGFENSLDSLGGPPTVAIDTAIAAPKTELVLGDAVTQRRGKQLLARVQQAMGGAEKLAAVTDYVEEVVYQLDPSAGGAQTNMTERWIAPGILRQDNVSGANKFSVYCDGKAGWVANAGGVIALSEVSLKQMQNDLFRVYYPLLVSDRVAGRKINALDDTTLEISDSSGHDAKMVVDPATGLLKTTFYDVPTENGPVPVIETYADYREVSGIRVPFRVSVTVSGRKYEELTVKTLQFNTGLKAQDLEKRP